MLASGLVRYLGLLSLPPSLSGNAIESCHIDVLYPGEALDDLTCYNYTILINHGQCNITAVSVYGALYALESFTQLYNNTLQQLAGSQVYIEDFPAYSHRGLMIDTGRRFFPLPLVYNLLDALSYAKMNVLHLHASDYCRFAIESLVYPELTANLTGINAGFYTQQNISNMIQYAKLRGIRVIPEIDMPGHAKGLAPLTEAGLEFCSSDNTQIYDDPAGNGVYIIENLIQEMASLFTDNTFHIGCDETQTLNMCTLNNTATFETNILNTLVNLGKTPEGWEEVCM